MKDLSLGKKSDIPTKYDPSVLSPLSRLDSRIKSGFDEFSTLLYGRDYWTAYETSWLNQNGIPQNRILNIAYDSNSKFFIESKSLKLYLYSLNNKKFDSLDCVKKLIQEDLEQALSTRVEVDLTESPRPILDNSLCIDSLEIEKIDSHPNSLVIEPGENEIYEEISTRLFRSLCPVTSQPDWATVYITYEGLSIQHKGLLQYLLSYRNHQGFHEECVESIFLEINKRCRVKKLSVRANFLRRGGIEFNPVRTTPGFEIKMSREERQ